MTAMDGTEDPQSYFSAAKSSGLDEELAKLKQMQQAILAGKQAGSPSRGPILNAPNPIIPTTGAAPYLYVDPSAKRFNPMSELQDNQGHDPAYLEQIRNQILLKQFQLLPPNTPNILMNTKRLPRYADDRSDLNDLLNSSPETKFLGKPGPTPKPTPTVAPKFLPVSYFT